jgi:NADH:ubiquinone oxidoreductase subunit 2 (subunit N)
VIVAASIATPQVDWLALSPSLALLAAAAICLLGAVLVPSRGRRVFSVVVAGAGFITAGVLAGVVFQRTSHQTLLIAESMSRDRLAAFTQVLVACFGLAAVLVSWGDRRRDHVGEYYALLAAAGGGMAFFVSAGNLVALPRSRVVLDLAVHPRRARHASEGVARGRPEVPDRRQLRLRDPALRIGADLRRHG